MRCLYAAVTVTNVDVKKSLLSKRIKLPVIQSKCEILFVVSLVTVENRWQTVLPAALPADVYWPRRLTVSGFLLKDHHRERKIIICLLKLSYMTVLFVVFFQNKSTNSKFSTKHNCELQLLPLNVVTHQKSARILSSSSCFPEWWSNFSVSSFVQSHSALFTAPQLVT